MTPEERAFAAAEPDALAAPVAAGRRLSPLRIMSVLVVLAAAAATAVVGVRSSGRAAEAAVPASSFMPYVDVTTTPQYQFEDASGSVAANLVLGFVVSSETDGCAPSWGGAYSPAEAASKLDLDRRIARLRQRGGQASVSFGGQAHTELAVACTDQARLIAAYRDVVRRYSVQSIDLDIEGDAASAPEVVARRARAIAAVQQEQQQAGRPLQVWLTLPVDPSGLTSTGRAVVRDTLAAHVHLAGVNAMTMDYGSSLPRGTSLTAANRSALTQLSSQLPSLYRAAGLKVSTAQAWQHMGATPMIGQNDAPAERFGLGEARALLAFGEQHHLRRLSMWSANRDQACGPNYANVAIVSSACSGVLQTPGAFAKIFARFTAGPAPSEPPTIGATASASATSIVDDPATSPYSIWSPVMPYSRGTKIVWHRNVYLAKWWTQGDTPDSPVAAASDTPWTLVGPVLPGEHPQPTPTLKAGTYPNWSASKTYRAGAKVLYQGVGYQAKWYTHGDQPGIIVTDPGQTPWEHITGR